MADLVGDIDPRNLALRSLALLVALALLVLPQALNSRSLILLMDDYGTVPAPIAEEEEVKHACSIGWSDLVNDDDHFLEVQAVPAIVDPYNDVEHGEVDVPPPKASC